MLFQLCSNIIWRFHPNEGVTRQKLKNIGELFFFKPLLNIRNYSHLRNLPNRQLGLGVKSTHTLHFVIKQFYTVWIIMPKRKDIDYTTSDGEFSRFIHKICSFKTIL